MVVIRGRLTPEVGAVVQRALEAATDRWSEVRAVPKADRLAEEVTPAQRRADALGCWLKQLCKRTSTAAPPATATKWCCTSTPNRCGGRGRSGRGGREWSDRNAGGGLRRGRRLRGDVATPVMRRGGGADGPRPGRDGARRRAQDADRAAIHSPRPPGSRPHCRFPGCTARRCDAHHIEQLVRRRPRPAWTTSCPVPSTSSFGARGRVRIDAAQRRDDDVPASQWSTSRDSPGAAGVFARLDATSCALDEIPVWDGTLFDAADAIDVLYKV